MPKKTSAIDSNEAIEGNTSFFIFSMDHQSHKDGSQLLKANSGLTSLRASSHEILVQAKSDNRLQTCLESIAESEDQSRSRHLSKVVLNLRTSLMPKHASILVPC
jgi:hypothetical protein